MPSKGLSDEIELKIRHILLLSVASVLLTRTGCTFDEDSDPSLCEFSQGEDDDFDWQLFRTHTFPHATPDLLLGLLGVVQVFITWLIPKSTSVPQLYINCTSVLQHHSSLTQESQRGKKMEENNRKTHLVVF
ncbi:receptor-type tyrosine-protein phosphatase U isoform X2 [Tachysurus ichikawai]